MRRGDEEMKRNQRRQSGERKEEKEEPVTLVFAMSLVL